MIDAEVPASGETLGNTGSSNYTTVAFVTGAGKGATFTPAKGDTGKKLLFPNTGIRFSDGIIAEYGTMGYFYCATQSTTDTTFVWRLAFSSYAISGTIYLNTKIHAFPLRCVRS